MSSRPDGVLRVQLLLRTYYVIIITVHVSKPSAANLAYNILGGDREGYCCGQLVSFIFKTDIVVT